MNDIDLKGLISSYENALTTSAIPSCVISTRSLALKDGDTFSVARDLLHPQWIIRTADPELISKADKVAKFDSPLGFSLQSTDDILYLSSLRRRMFFLETLKGSGTLRQSNANYVLVRMLDTDWLFRWCNANSVYQFSDLTEDHFVQYEKDSSSGDVVDLLPVISWLDELLEEPEFLLPKYAHGKKFRLQWDRIASTLGVTAKSLALSTRFMDAFRKRFPLFLEKEGLDQAQVTIRVKELKSPGKPAFGPRRFNGWDNLNRLSANGTLVFDPLHFRPETSMEKSDSTRKRTTSLYPHDMMRLLSTAARWVSIYSPYVLKALVLRSEAPDVPVKHYHALLHRLHDELDENWPEDFPKIFLALSTKIPSGNRLLLSEAVSLLFVACAIVIGMLGGRRRGEVENLMADCIYGGMTGLMLSIYIEKTLQDVDGIPVPEAVLHAVNLLEKLSATSRSQDNHSFLFRFKSNLADGGLLRVDTRFANLLVKFAETSGLAPPVGEHVWRLNYHMFRKGFVISFYHGNLWRSFDATNWALRHKSGDMTAIYMDDEETGSTLWLRKEVQRISDLQLERLTDEQHHFLANAKATLKDRNELSGIWNETRQEFFVAKMMQIYDGSERPIGRGAARLLDHLRGIENQAHAKIRLSAVPTNGEPGIRNDVLKEVKIFVATNFLEPIPGIPMYCTFKRGATDHSEIANCLKARKASRRPWTGERESFPSDKPDYSFSGAHPCLSCELCALLNDDQQAVENTISEMREEVVKAATPALAASAQSIVDDVFNLLKQAERAVDGKQRHH